MGKKNKNGLGETAGLAAGSAAGIGTAVGALGVVSASGTVAGLSAAGMTSGLAAVGLGSMAAGIGVVAAAPLAVAGVVGFGVHKLFKD